MTALKLLNNEINGKESKHIKEQCPETMPRNNAQKQIACEQQTHFRSSLLCLRKIAIY